MVQCTAITLHQNFFSPQEAKQSPNLSETHLPSSPMVEFWLRDASIAPIEERDNICNSNCARTSSSFRFVVEKFCRELECLPRP